MTDLPAGTVTFLITDIAGSTRRWAEGDMSDALSVHDELTRVAIESNEGVWVKHTGDGVLAAFHDPGLAVAAAIALMRSFDVEDWNGDPIRIRAGIHTGTATPTDGDYFGLTVSSAARIAHGAHPGQIVLSSTTGALIESAAHDGFSLVRLGEHRFKGLRGAVTLYQVEAPGIAISFPPIESLIRVEHNLPPRLTTFVGRESELAELVEIVGTHRLTTLTGVGGAGKTRLSLEAAHALAEDFKDGTWFVELAPISDPDAVAPALAGALGIRHEAGDAIDVVDRMLDHMRARQMLLVFDNCEHVLRAVALLVTRILPTCPEVKVISSSREGLGVSGERIWQTPSLALGAGSDAVELFLRRAEDSGTRIEEESLSNVERICEMLDGMPLAIELAAARCRVLSPAQIEQRLDDRFRLLTGGSSMALPRQQTLEAAVDWSYQLLTEIEQALFERLSVFQGGFTIAAVEAICTDHVIDDLATLDTVAGLVDKSMIGVDTTSGEARYSMLETLRHYAVRKLQDHGETDRWKLRHAEWFAEQADAHSPQRTQDLNQYGWLDGEAPNLSAALEWCRGSNADLIAPLAEALGRHTLINLGDPPDAVELYELALEHTDPRDSERTADVLAWLARSLGDVGRIDDARRTGDRAIGIARGMLEAPWAPRVLRSVAGFYAFEPEVEHSQSIETARLAVEAARSNDDDVSLHLALRTLAWSLIWAEAEYERIEGVCREALTLAGDDQRAMQEDLSPLLLASMTQDALHGTDLTTGIEDEILALSDGKPSSGFDEWYAWTGIRRADWDLARAGIDHLHGHLKGRARLSVLIPEAAMQWMRGNLEDADRALVTAYDLGRIGRWHHDFYPIWADVASCQGRLDRVEEIVAEHMALDLRPSEEPLRLASLRTLVQAHVDAGDRAGASQALDKMREIRELWPNTAAGSVQLGSPFSYLYTAEAELTRVTGPDPAAWERAQNAQVWEYFKTYCQARRAEAMRQLGSPDAEPALAHAIDRAKKADARWIVSWLISM